MAKRRRFSSEFQLKVIREFKAQKPLSWVSRIYQLYPWHYCPPDRLLGQLRAENAFLKKS